MDISTIKDSLGAALAGAPSPLAAADSLCRACVDLLGIDGASVSLMDTGALPGTFGSSSELSRMLDELQFTYGQGPCLDAVATGRPVVVEDLNSPEETRWPALSQALLGEGIQAVYALPVAVARTPIGALDLYRHSSGPLGEAALAGGLWAADLASLPLLDLMASATDWEARSKDLDSWEELASLERVEVYQATGMIMAALRVTTADALVRLRAYAIAHALTASAVAYKIIKRELVITDEWGSPDHEAGAR
ncbi:MAG TPA: GAF and ANTAR domain-containing protein [Mycobacteriales bacterium]|nr:GAF and ANTAR domain-containing protein [Mycobacteriales bacterium]